MAHFYFPQQSKLARWCLSVEEFDFTIKHHTGSANVVPDVLSRAPFSHPSTGGDHLYLPPKPVICFITSLIGFGISYLEPSCVAEIFSDTLTCLTLACNPVPLHTFATHPKSSPSKSPIGASSLPPPPSQKNPPFPHLLQQFLSLSRLCQVILNPNTP